MRGASLEEWTMHASLRDILAPAVTAGAILITSCGLAQAHHAPTGWTYPYACCSGNDCREVSSTAIVQRPNGYVIKMTGEVVGYKDRRLRRSPDGLYHWCSIAGLDSTRTICLFVPPQLF
jgi:hypothetical protein